LVWGSSLLYCIEPGESSWHIKTAASAAKSAGDFRPPPLLTSGRWEASTNGPPPPRFVFHHHCFILENGIKIITAAWLWYGKLEGAVVSFSFHVFSCKTSMGICSLLVVLQPAPAANSGGSNRLFLLQFNAIGVNPWNLD
jgi:hypothetical protein